MPSPTVLAGTDLLATLVGVPAWSSMGLVNSWANFGSGFVNAQYRLWPLINEVEVIGVITGGTITGGTTIATLPNAPVSTQPIPVMVSSTSGGAGGQSPRLDVTTGGALQVQNLPTGTVTIMFHGWYSL